MDRHAFLWGGIGTAAFAGSLMLLMPPTTPKTDWGAARAASAPVVAAKPVPATPEPVNYAPVPQLYHLDERQQEDGADYSDPETREEMTVAAHDRDYGDGYAWAADRGLDDTEACRMLHGDRREGCLDYVTSL